VKEEIEIQIREDTFFFSVVPVQGNTYVNIYGLDISKRKITEKALGKSEQRFRDLVENSLVGIGIVQDTRIIYRNPEQERLWGPISNGAHGSVFDHVHPDDIDKVAEGLTTILDRETPYVDMELRVFNPQSADSKRDMKWVYCRTSLTEYQGKEALLVNMTDISKTKQLENLLRMQDKMASLGRVAAGIAHEIRNPLSGINIYLNTLEKIYDNPDNHEKVLSIIDRLKSASDKIESVIRRVMDFAKPGAPNFVQGHINKPVEEAINLASVTFRKSGIEIHKEMSADLPRCRIDMQMIEGVILNLLTNATEAMKGIDRQKRIRVSAGMRNDNLRVTVSDSGPGIPVNLQGKIFDPFYTTKSGSTGIGLSLSQRIIADHGGSLRASSSRWGGARFTIELPVTQGEKEK